MLSGAPTLYPLGQLPSHHQRPSRGGSVPASTILLIDADTGSGETISAILTGVGYTVTTIADPKDAFPKVGDHQLTIIDVVRGPRPARTMSWQSHSMPASSKLVSRLSSSGSSARGT